MKNISSRKNLLKDAAILLVLAALLVALPWTKDFLERGEKTVSVAQDQTPAQVQEIGRAPNTNPTVMEKQKAFIEEVFPKVSSWQVGALEPYLAEATKSGNWSADIGSVLNILSERLGHLEHYSEPEPIHIADTALGAQDKELTIYEFVAHYETGVADINLMLADNSGKSVLYSFNINVYDEPLSL